MKKSIEDIIKELKKSINKHQEIDERIVRYNENRREQERRRIYESTSYYNKTFSTSSSGVIKYLSNYVFALASSETNSELVISNGSTLFTHTFNESEIPGGLINANEMFVEGDNIWIVYNWNNGTNKIVRLENVKVNFASSKISYNIAEIKEITDGVNSAENIHGNDMNDEFMFFSCRITPTMVIKINKYNFNDLEILAFTDNIYDHGDIIRYFDGYLYLHSMNGNSFISKPKVVKINANNLQDYEIIINETDSQDQRAGILNIYKGTIIITDGYSDFKIKQYDLNGNFLREYLIESGLFTLPHSSIIMDNMIYITVSFEDYINENLYPNIFKFNLDTFEVVDTGNLPGYADLATDDTTMDRSGNWYVGTELVEDPSFDSRPVLFKINKDDLSDIKVVGDLNFTCYAVTNTYYLELNRLARNRR